MREKAISGMMAETHKRNTAGVDKKIGQLEIIAKQKDESITQLEEKVSLLQQQCESYRNFNVAIPTNVKPIPLPVSDVPIHWLLMFWYFSLIIKDGWDVRCSPNGYVYFVDHSKFCKFILWY